MKFIKKMYIQKILKIIATGILFSGVLYGVYRSIKYDKNIAEQKK